MNGLCHGAQDERGEMRDRLVVSPKLYFAIYALCVPLALGVIANWASLQAMKERRPGFRPWGQ